MVRADIQRALKLGLAATLAMVVVSILNLPSSFWAPLSALAVMQSQVGSSLAAARNYIMASILGVLFGAASLSLIGNNIYVAGLDVTLMAALCLWLKLPTVVTIAGGIAPVMVLTRTPHLWEYGAYRVTDIRLASPPHCLLPC